MAESVDEFLKRGGKITVLPPCKSSEMDTYNGKTGEKLRQAQQNARDSRRRTMQRMIGGNHHER